MQLTLVSFLGGEMSQKIKHGDCGLQAWFSLTDTVSWLPKDLGIK
jgi:hypothetical protein